MSNRRQTIGLLAIMLVLATWSFIRSGTISRYSATKATGDPLTAAEYNGDIDTAYTAINGNLDSANLATNAVGTDEIQNDAVTAAKLLDTGEFTVYSATATGNVSCSSFTATSSATITSARIITQEASWQRIWYTSTTVANRSTTVLASVLSDDYQELELRGYVLSSSTQSCALQCRFNGSSGGIYAYNNLQLFNNTVSGAYTNAGGATGMYLVNVSSGGETTGSGNASFTTTIKNVNHDYSTIETVSGSISPSGNYGAAGGYTFLITGQVFTNNGVTGLEIRADHENTIGIGSWFELWVRR